MILAVAGLAHGTGSTVVGAGGRTGVSAAGVFGLGGGSIGTSEVSCFDELDDRWVLEGLAGDLAGFAGAKKEFFAAGEGDAEWFAGLVGEVHG